MATATNYNAIGGQQASPYGNTDPHFTESAGYITPQPARKRLSNWIKIGVPVLILVIIGAVLGGVLGSRNASKSNNNNSNGPSGSTGGEAAASSAASVKLEIGRFATSTNVPYLMPVYPATVGTLFLIYHTF